MSRKIFEWLEMVKSTTPSVCAGILRFAKDKVLQSMSFLDSHFRTDWLSWLGLGNQVGSPYDHLANCHLPSTPKEPSTMRVELTEKLLIEVVGIFTYPQSTLELGITQTGLVSTWIEQKDRKACMCSCKCQQPTC